MKKNFILKCFIHLLIYLSFYSGLASDLAGSQLTYTHIGGANYHFTYVLYRDCFGTSAPSLEILNITSGSCSISQQYNLIPIAGNGNEISNDCPTAITTCNGGSVTGIQKWIYEGDVSLPGQCSDWLFSVSHCCFSYSITTSSNIFVSESYAEARLDNTGGDNSSPAFTNEPVISICQSQDFHYNNGMLDAEGDSLAYILTPVLNDVNQSITYLPGYSSQQPVTSTPQVSLDQVTGDLFIHPTAIETGVMTYTVLEYRNGNLIGSTTRTILINVIACTNVTPELSGINGTSDSVAYVLPGTTICFDINSDDADAGQQLTLSWNNGIPGATFTTAGAPHPTGTFCWQTSMGDLRTLPYTFTARIADDNCAYNGVGIYSYHIYVTLDTSHILLLAEEAEYSSLLIYPNPSDGTFTLNDSRNISSIKIIDNSGKIIQASQPEENRLFIDAPPGIYWIEIIYNDGRTLNQKLFVKK